MRPPILYHYCSNAAFYSIVRQGAIRLSLLTMSNDAKEGRHLLDWTRKWFPADFKHKEELFSFIDHFSSSMSALGFCLSEQKDMLSQWRAYASDGRGIAIGFDSSLLQSATDEETDSARIGLSPVAYDEGLIKQVLDPSVASVIKHYEAGKMVAPWKRGLLQFALSADEKEKDEAAYKAAFHELFEMLRPVFNLSYSAKSVFFEEEREWRILTFLLIVDGRLSVDCVEFEPADDKVKPYKLFPPKGMDKSCIKEVVLGPRNTTPVEVIRLFLDQNGFGSASITRSSGSYR